MHYYVSFLISAIFLSSALAVPSLGNWQNWLPTRDLKPRGWGQGQGWGWGHSWPNGPSTGWTPPPENCMSSADAQAVADNFQNLIAAYSSTLANTALTPDFSDYSDSVITLIDGGCNGVPIPLGSATFDSRAAFEAGQGAQPPIPFQQLKVWNNCDTVFLRWVSKQTPQQVTGIIVLETTYSNGAWLIDTVYSEFNSGAWLVNIGTFKPSNCSA